MTELRAQLQSALGDSYVVDREIGGGGMGRVFLVRDESLGRRVVVKVVSQSDSPDVSIERFKLEIQFAARLQHPNIVPLLSAGHASGSPYYVMPYIDGESLRSQLQRGSLPIAAAVSILKDVARALAYAHEQGVVHRDIKPENVLVAGDAAVVSDFGIAKALSAARTGAGGVALTSAGTSVGTPAYMAPEQATGDPGTDHRADIYSFGCLAYELVTGQQPFPGSTPHRVIAAHLSDPVPSPLPLRPDCPHPLVNLIARCLEKDPALRPQSAREIVGILDTVGTPTGPTRVHGARIEPRYIAAAGAAVALILAAVVLLGRSGTADDIQTLTVLPFVALGGDSAQAYLADGISEELATTLAKTQGIRVVGRTAANRFRGRRDIDVRAVGESLGVALVLQGSVRRTGSELRVLANLSDTRTGEDIWSDVYQRRADDVLGVRDAIGQAVIQKLRERSGARVGSLASQRGSEDAESYDLYLRAVYLLRRRAVAQAEDYFERAIARDSGFARAYAGLSTTLALYPYFTTTSAREVEGRLLRVARQALSLDSTLAEAHTALAMSHMHSMNWQESQREHLSAIGHDPSDHEAHLQYGRFLLYVGRTDSALAEFRRARSLDPYSSLYSGWIAGTLHSLGRSAEAAAELQRAVDLDSLNPNALKPGAQIFLDAGDTARARMAARRFPPFGFWAGLSAYFHGRLGEPARADSIRRELERTRQWFSRTALAYAALGRGDTSAALNELERATQEGEYWPAIYPVSDRIFEGVWQSGRFRSLVERTGLDPAVFLDRPTP